MKKRLILGLAALAAVTLTSCQKDQVINQVPQEQAIEFGTYLGRDAQTKVSELTTESLKSEGFGVYAYYTGPNEFPDVYPTSESFTGTKPAVNFMNNQSVTYTTATDPHSWTYSPVKYWPNTSGDKISFFAYAPHSNYSSTWSAGDLATTKYAITTGVDGTTGVPVVNYTVNTEVSKHEDITFANAILNQTKTNEKITFKFYHALSRIGFKVKQSKVHENATFTLKSVSINGKFYPSGSLNLYKSKVDDTSDPKVYTADWTTTDSEEKTFTVSESGGVTVPVQSANAADFSENYIMVIPNTTQQTYTITANYDYKYEIWSGSNQYETINNTVSGTVNNVTFEAGKAYTFTLLIGMDAIEFDVTEVDSWRTGTTHNVSIGN